MTEPQGTGNTAPLLTIVSVLASITAFVAYVVRILVKLRKSNGWEIDDSAISAGIAFSFVQLFCICIAIHWGYGNPWESLANGDKVDIHKALYAGQIMYVTAIGLTKISVSCFVEIVLTRDPGKTRISRCLTTLCVAWTMVSILIIAVRSPITKPWLTRNGTQAMWIRWLAVEIMAIILDVLEAVVTATFVFALQMKWPKKLIVFATLNCRLFLVIPIAFRLHYLDPLHTPYNSQVESMLMQATSAFVIVIASITCLRPFLRPFDPAAFSSHVATGPRYAMDTSKLRSGFHELDSIRSTNRSNQQPGNLPVCPEHHSSTGIRLDEEDEVPLNSRVQARSNWQDNLEHSVRVMHDDSDKIGMDNGIKKKQGWSVKISERQSEPGKALGSRASCSRSCSVQRTRALDSS